MTREGKPSTWSFWLMILCLIALLFVLNGISLVPPQHYQRLSLNPFTTRMDIAQDNYWQENILLPVIAFYTGLNSPLAFNTLCFMILIAAYLLFAQLGSARFGFRLTLLFTAVLIASPLSTVLLSWLGTPDGLTFLLTIPLLFSNSVTLIFMLSLLGVTNHVVFIIAAFEILALRWAIKDQISYAHIVAQIAGSVMGYLVVQLFIQVNDIHRLSRLDFILIKGLDSWLHVNSTNLSLTVFSFFHVEWLLLLVCSAAFFKRDYLFFSLVWGFLLINFGITFVTLDQTRIFSLLSWGMLLMCLFRSYHLDVNSLSQEIRHQKTWLNGLAIISTLSFLLPRYYSWEGSLFLAPLWAYLSSAVK